MSHEIRATVKEKYGKAALAVIQGSPGGCGCGCGCGPQAPEDASANPITGNLYDEGTTSTLPEEAVLASLGCGNPTALAELKEGEVVLDLGSGGGIDVLLSAQRVGSTGKAYGVDMTEEMLALARRNAAEAGVENVEFLKGEIEALPLPDESVDVVISNCVINLSANKDKVFAEAFRVLRPGGRFAVSDIVSRGEMPPEMRRNMELWVGCIAGALEEGQFREMLAAAGFQDVSLEPTRTYRAEDAGIFLEDAGMSAAEVAREVDGKFMSALVRGRKPGV